MEQIKEEYLKKNYAEAELLAQAFSFSIFNPDSATNQDSFWQETAASLLTALILAHIQDCVKEDELTNERRFEAWQKKRAAYKKLTPKEQEEAKAMCERRKQLGDILLDPRVSAISLEEEFVYIKENEKRLPCIRSSIPLRSWQDRKTRKDRNCRHWTVILRNVQ